MASIDETMAVSGDENSVADCVFFPDTYSKSTRGVILLASAAVGGVGGFMLSGAADVSAALWSVLGVAAVAGGVLSTWSPCGYSSISLLRPNGRGVKEAIGWLPTFAMHGLGYAAGAVILGTLLGAIGAIAGFTGIASTIALTVLAIIGLLYGAHQLDLVRAPYPQRRAQVPHDARNRFPKWVIGGLYGLSLGLDYLTYVQTPLLYMMTLAAVFTGNIPAAIAIIALFNLGRYLPVAVNLLPCKDYAIQAWLARNQERAAMVDGAILAALGAAFAVLALI
ncbi:methylamine utilization protein MauF [Paracoccus cavernae]|uniref:Methylamine utilization protein MauF n=1 Tax=Paracoccus cavernae TaxID=1571207 RepID=A0ABT8D846_9RHOB|nr:methylamine utilization protein MauF [Paracoccus cavernae]